jgi:hypothetical protein
VKIDRQFEQSGRLWVPRYEYDTPLRRYERYRDRFRPRAVVTAGTSYVNSNGTNQSSGTVTMTTVDASSLTLVTVCTDDNGTANVISAPTASGLTFLQIGTTIRSVNGFNFAVFRAYTTASLGSTVISCSWTQANDWVLGATDYTGTAGTAANNGSDAIGTNTTNTGSGTAISVTVNSSSHNNSKYYGGMVTVDSGGNIPVKGANYTNNVTGTHAAFVSLLTELSTNPVSPAANTAVNGTCITTTWGIVGIELLVAASAASGLFGTGRLPGLPPQVRRG